MACAFALASALSIRARAADARDVSDQLRAGRVQARAEAVQAVLDHRATASLDALTAASGRETNPEVRLRLLTAAFQVDRSSAEPFLLAALAGDASPLVRAVSAQVLMRAAPDDAIRRAFIACLAGDKDRDVRRSCASGLGYHHAPDAVAALTAAASDPDPELRRRVGLALLRHPKSASIEAVLTRLDNDGDSSVAALVRARHQAARSAP